MSLRLLCSRKKISALLLSKILFVAFLFSITKTSAQQVYAHWNPEVKKVNDCEFDLIFKVKIDPTWHLYSQIPVEGDGPLPTEIQFKKSPDYELVGKTKESKPHEEMDKVFEVMVKYFEFEATFTQRIKVLSNKKFQVTGKYYYQVCTDSKCINHNDEFVFNVDGTNCKTKGIRLKEVADADSIKKADSLALVKKADSLASTDKKDTLTSSATVSTDTVTPASESEKSEENKSESLWAIFIKGFAGGLFAVFTPCLFPLIPMNVSFFTKRSKTRAKGISNASLYSFFVIFIYVALGLGVALAIGPDRLNALSTNKYVNIVFFLIFLIFAISFFGAFEITLPSGFVNKMDSMSDRGGFIGIFFMAFTLVLVSFSCTGPIASSLLIEAASTGKLLGPGLGMFGFGLALALPFGFFAYAPSLMNTLPKSGGWLNAVKVCLGFIELAFAMKFISNADLVTQSYIITREVFITSWIVIFGLMGAYLLGAFKMAHDSPVSSVSIPRLMFAILSFFIVIYILPGLWGAPLKLLSGILPPSNYSEAPAGFGSSSKAAAEIKDEEFKPYIHIGVHNIQLFKNDYEHAMAYAKKVNKPLMIDFTGYNCANCRKTEDYIWSDEGIKNRLNNDVVLVELFADDDAELPENEKKKVLFYGKERTLETVGDKWKYFEFQHYNAVQQPLYVIVDHNGKTLAGPRGYESGIEEYAKWMDEGIKKFKEQKK